MIFKVVEWFTVSGSRLCAILNHLVLLLLPRRGGWSDGSCVGRRADIRSIPLHPPVIPVSIPLSVHSSRPHSSGETSSASTGLKWQAASHEFCQVKGRWESCRWSVRDLWPWDSSWTESSMSMQERTSGEFILLGNYNDNILHKTMKYRNRMPNKPSIVLDKCLRRRQICPFIHMSQKWPCSTIA